MTAEPEFTVDVVKRTDGTGWVEHWYCPQPMPWDEYCILGDAWNDDRSIRSIYEIEILS